MDWLQEVDREDIQYDAAYSYAQIEHIAATRTQGKPDTLFISAAGGYPLVYNAKRR